MPPLSFKITLPLIAASIVFYLTVLPLVQYPLTSLLKPLPIMLLIGYSWQSSLERSQKRLLLAALSCSCLGDIILTLPFNAALHTGIAAFMGAHAAYIALFLKNRSFQRQNILLFLPIFLLVMVGGYVLWPYLGALQIPVAAYLFLLTSMVFYAFQRQPPSARIRLGACLFLLSDFTLALSLFVLAPNKIIAVLIMLFYYAAQLLLVMSIVPRIQPHRVPTFQTN